MSDKTVSYTIETEVPSNYLGNLLGFIYRKYILPQAQRFVNVSRQWWMVILSVLGHEFGHLKGRDPLLLYGLTAAEFLFRFYVFFPLFPFVFFSYLFFLYFWAVMAVIYFIAKFFEARADLVSAMVMGQPQVLAEALEKIGFRRLLYERMPSFRVQEWISLEHHPPIYIRVDRLDKLKVPVQVKHPLVRSVKDVINGFLASLRGY